jgi:hypothetical protein
MGHVTPGGSAGHEGKEIEPLVELRITNVGSRAAAEALVLEIRRLARKHGVEVQSVRVALESDEPVTDEPTAGSADSA